MTPKVTLYIGYIGVDAHGATWARCAVVLADGSECPHNHVSVKVSAGRDDEAAMRLARELLGLRLATTRPMVSGGAC